MKSDKKKVLRRLAILEGQISGIKNMIENDEYCIDIINQTSAIRSGLSSLEDILLEDHLSQCVVGSKNPGNQKSLVKEVISVFKKAKQK